MLALDAWFVCTESNMWREAGRGRPTAPSPGPATHLKISRSIAGGSPQSPKKLPMRTTRYRYEAKDPEGGLHQGHLEASTRAHAKSLLAQQNLEPIALQIDRLQESEAEQLIDLVEKKLSPAQRAPEVFTGPKLVRLATLKRFLYSPAALWRRDILATPQEKAIFLNELGAFLASGIDLSRALHFLSAPQPHQSNERLRQTLETLGKELSLAGTAIPDALAKTRLFSPLELARIAASEKGGKLDLCLVQIAKDLQEQVRLTHSLKAQLATPLAVLAITWLLLPVLLSVAAKTSASLGASDNGLLHWLAHPLSLACLWIFPLVLAALGSKALQTQAQRLPVLGRLYHSWQLCFSAKALAELLDSGVSLSEALPLAGSIALLRGYEQALQRVREQGKGLAEAVEPFYPPLLLQMLSVGETTGQVPRLLLCGVRMLEEDCRYQVETAVRYLEPVLLLGVGILVGLVCLLSLQPLFEVLQTL